MAIGFKLDSLRSQKKILYLRSRPKALPILFIIYIDELG
ncbi:hypothetical protein REIFOR_01132 [Reinekea forsetii]|uniref:Uncharacterized protein n=1 Tax=Reinekea forsetii TaxID=1336806 RepID=A0A2K8KN79_9GAMM|nr:hypothetical protein REIFOR_01132 [Reinekea forsetii]